MFFTAVDIAAPLIVGMLTVPSTNNGQPYFVSPVNGTPSAQLNFSSWILGMLPAGSVAASLYIDKNKIGGSNGPAFKNALLWFTSMCGIGGTVTGMVANSLLSNPKGSDYAGDILNNMSNIIAPLLMDSLVESTEGLSAVIACALTEVCGTTGAILYGVEG